MNKILIVILIISLFFIEGCTVIGYSIGKGIQRKNSHDMEEIKSTKEKSWLTISMKNEEVIKGQIISCTNDTLFVTFQADRNSNAPISNEQYLAFSQDKIIYKIPVDQIKDIIIEKAHFGGVFAMIGFVFDFIVFLIIISGPVGAPSGNFLG
ncbi:MAG: hypothetical protein PF570_01275 [Candidatus Cloacimonetes bacterium]|jgi:hypothetical protein|nr:hypothetical protein [Candidatus Cloacimonadota bacterium]